MLRQSGAAWGRMAARRFESTASTNAKKATEKAGETAKDTAKDTAAKVSATVSEYSTKAAQGLSKVTATAGPAITGAARGVAESLSKVGGRTGRLVGFIESMLMPLSTDSAMVVGWQAGSNTYGRRTSPHVCYLCVVWKLSCVVC